MAEMSEIKKTLLRLSDKELMKLLARIPTAEAAPATASKTERRWFDRPLTGLTKEGTALLAELEEENRTSRSADKKRLRYLRALKGMKLTVPPLFRETISAQEMYRHLRAFCVEHDIPEEIVSRVVPVMISYIETGHMRPIIFVGEAGCGKTTALCLLVEEALQLPTAVVKVPQADGGHGMTGDCGKFVAADVGSIAKARLRLNALLVAYIFDEADKVVHSISQANVDDELLSITDESCSDICDNYLETTLVGLEHCPMFFTANDLDKVSPILADRCTVVHFPNASAERIKAISRKYVDKMLDRQLYQSVSFDYDLMDKYIDRLVHEGVTSLRQHQQMVENVLERALELSLMGEEDRKVWVTEEMFERAQSAVLGRTKHRVGFAV